LPAGPVVNDLGARDGQCVVGIDVVKVTESEQDVVDRLLGVLGLETLDEQRQALVGRAPGSLFDNHQVEVVAQLAAVADDLELHGHQVAELRNTQAIDLLGRFKKVLRAALVRVQELHLGGREDAVEGPRHALGDGERACRGQAPGQLVEIDAAVVEEEAQVPADPVPEVDSDGRPTSEVRVRRVAKFPLMPTNQLPAATQWT
jgi:hypothetical protein